MNIRKGPNVNGIVTDTRHGHYTWTVADIHILVLRRVVSRIASEGVRDTTRVWALPRFMSA